MRQRAEDYIREELADQVDVADEKRAQANITAEREHLRAAGLHVGNER